jgi:hypothetical protein
MYDAIATCPMLETFCLDMAKYKLQDVFEQLWPIVPVTPPSSSSSSSSRAVTTTTTTTTSRAPQSNLKHLILLKPGCDFSSELMGVERVTEMLNALVVNITGVVTSMPGSNTLLLMFKRMTERELRRGLRGHRCNFELAGYSMFNVRFSWCRHIALTDLYSGLLARSSDLNSMFRFASETCNVAASQLFFANNPNLSQDARDAIVETHRRHGHIYVFEPPFDNIIKFRRNPTTGVMHGSATLQEVGMITFLICRMLYTFIYDIKDVVDGKTPTSRQDLLTLNRLLKRSWTQIHEVHKQHERQNKVGIRSIRYYETLRLEDNIVRAYREYSRTAKIRSLAMDGDQQATTMWNDLRAMTVLAETPSDLRYDLPSPIVLYQEPATRARNQRGVKVIDANHSTTPVSTTSAAAAASAAVEEESYLSQIEDFDDFAAIGDLDEYVSDEEEVKFISGLVRPGAAQMPLAFGDEPDFFGDGGEEEVVEVRAVKQPRRRESDDSFEAPKSPGFEPIPEELWNVGGDDDL